MPSAKKLRKKLRKMERLCDKYPELFVHLCYSMNCTISIDEAYKPQHIQDILPFAVVNGQRSAARDLLSEAWGIIANASDWGKNPEWQQAAERFRERYHSL